MKKLIFILTFILVGLSSSFAQFTLNVTVPSTTDTCFINGAINWNVVYPLHYVSTSSDGTTKLFSTNTLPLTFAGSGSFYVLNQPATWASSSAPTSFTAAATGSTSQNIIVTAWKNPQNYTFINLTVPYTVSECYFLSNQTGWSLPTNAKKMTLSAINTNTKVYSYTLSGTDPTHPFSGLFYAGLDGTYRQSTPYSNFTNPGTGNTLNFTASAFSAIYNPVPAITSSPYSLSGFTSGISAQDLANTNLTVSSGELVIDQTATVKSVTVVPGAKLTLNSSTPLTASNGITLQSNSSGTGTLIDNFTTPTVNATVQQYMPQGRNWYLSTPVSSGNSSNLTAAGLSASVSYWNEVGNAWVNNYSGSLTPGLGYIAVSSAGTGTNNASFSGTLNTGNVPVTLTRTGIGIYAGFNLVANPYPSYLSWSAVATDPINTNVTTGANMPTGTIWYRTVNYNGKSAWLPNTSYNVNDVVYNGTNFYQATSAGTSAASGGPSTTAASITDGSVVWAYQGSIYIFATVNASGVATPSTVSYLIPPMQAFWVKTTGGTLTFTNAMRSHNTTGGTDAMKAPKSSALVMPLLRLNVTNGVSADESVIYASDNASNDFDSYDAPKYFNTVGSNQPQIYTQIGNEKLAINAVKGITYDTEIPLGVTISTAGSFSIKASQFSNFDAGTKVILKDYLDSNNPVVTDLSNGAAYTFSSDAVNTTNRFSIIFKSGSIVSALNNPTDINNSIFVSKNANNQISVNIPAEMIGKASVSVFNAVGQKLENRQLENAVSVLSNSYTSGIYLVSVVGNGKTTIRKVVIN